MINCKGKQTSNQHFNFLVKHTAAALQRTPADHPADIDTCILASDNTDEFRGKINLF